MSNLFVKIYDLLMQDKRLVIARIVKQSGSAPRTVGTRCLILEDGTLLGSIGGGILEYNVLGRAVDIFKTGKSDLYQYRFMGKESDNISMVCGGAIDVFLEPVFPENETGKRIFGRIQKMIQTGSKGLLVTGISENITAVDESGRILYENDGSSDGSISGFNAGSDELHGISKNEMHEFEDHNIRILVEAIEPDDVLFLFGGGHISSFLAPIAKMIGFHVVVIDDRSEFANSFRFPDADEIRVVQFSELDKHIRITDSSYIVIMTRGHVTDKTVLGRVVSSGAAYIGMISSKRKRKVIYDSLIEEGCPAGKLELVHSPIGLDIGAETPEEIAVSVAAELIKIRTKRRAAVK